MSSEPLEHGADLQKQFKKAIIKAGPLKGAKYLDVGLEDLRKAARSYRADARFNQFAKRSIAEKTLARDSPANPEPSGEQLDISNSPQCWTKFKARIKWILSKMEGRWMINCFIIFWLVLVLSRPMFYVVLAKTIGVLVKLALRRSIGIITVILDAILDEAAASLESSLISQNFRTLPGQHHHSQQPHPLITQDPFGHWLFHILFGIAGGIIGRRWFPVAQ